MANRTLHAKAQAFDALVSLLTESGASQEGEVPVEFVRALKSVDEPGRAEEVAKAHREGRGPPEWADPPENAGSTGGGPP